MSTPPYNPKNSPVSDNRSQAERGEVHPVETTVKRFRNKDRNTQKESDKHVKPTRTPEQAS